ncbi:uncharacterized protein LOC122957830 [Acropora millepora]|uniref:uncharacterized protein LOC122957830 n=1 Tax=Acropora millepora TaxID=45264 RepID=UPI001CF3EA2C|nr:uncharacterized protein LOC122957830 [Acropora millepora]
MSCTVEQTEFLENLRLHLIDLSRRLEQDSRDVVADYVLYRLQQVARHLSRIAASAPGNVFEEVQLSLSEITSVLEDAERSWLPVSFAVRSTGSVGRPKFEISKDQLEYLVEYELKTPDIAKALGVSVSTIKRRLREFNISSRATLTEISDHDLDSVVRSIHTEFPNAGYRRVLSQLILRGIKVPQRRVRESMQRTDADGVAFRWLSITPRAVYCVSGPLALWHIDGNHKLIR